MYLGWTCSGVLLFEICPAPLGPTWTTWDQLGQVGPTCPSCFTWPHWAPLEPLGSICPANARNLSGEKTSFQHGVLRSALCLEKSSPCCYLLKFKKCRFLRFDTLEGVVMVLCFSNEAGPGRGLRSLRPSQKSQKYEYRESVGVILHHFCGWCSTIPFLDFYTAGSEGSNRRMNKTPGETVRVCLRGRNEQCAVARDTEANPNRLFT